MNTPRPLPQSSTSAKTQRWAPLYAIGPSRPIKTGRPQVKLTLQACLLLAVAAFESGCGTRIGIDNAGQQSVGYFPAKQFAPVANPQSTPERTMARIIILRAQTVYGHAFDHKVLVRYGDQITTIGTVPPKTSLCFDEPAGEMEISISADHPHFTKFNLSGGMNHYLQWAPHLTWSGLVELGAEEGKRKLRECIQPPSHESPLPLSNNRLGPYL